MIAVTGVDAKGRLLLEAGRAAHVDFAARGELEAASGRSGKARVRGTSFAAPIVAGRLAVLGSVEAVAREARDLGAPGVDPVFGRGLVEAR